MKIFYQESETGIQGNLFVLIIDKKEAKTLVEIAEAAAAANKKKQTFKRWAKELIECLPCF
jgi:hypothetical protein